MSPFIKIKTSFKHFAQVFGDYTSLNVNGLHEKLTEIWFCQQLNQWVCRITLLDKKAKTDLLFGSNFGPEFAI